MSLTDGALAVALPGDRIRISTDNWTEPFWLAAREQRLTCARCGDCGTFRSPPTPFCWRCRSQVIEWPTLPGTATVFSFAICNRSPYPDVPDFTYIPAVVDLDEVPGARLVSNLVGVAAGSVFIGMKVQVAWHSIQDGWNLPVFVAAI